MIEKAIAVYLDNSDKLEEEFSWLYKTWKLFSLDNEFDLVVYYNPSAKERLSKFEGIISIEMEPVRYSKIYKFLNSHYFCTDPYNEKLKKYKYLIKTDCDVFLTHNLKGYEPNKFQVGLGGYYPQTDEKKVNFIKKVSKDLNIAYNHMTGIGASFFGRTEEVLSIVDLQARITEYLLSTTFKNKEQKDIESGFHAGISSMIGGECAINASFCNQHVNLYTLDTKCWVTTKFGSDVLHIHAWHSYDFWSKHQYFEGKYKNIHINFSEAFDNTANFCHWIATTELDELMKYKKFFK